MFPILQVQHPQVFDKKEQRSLAYVNITIYTSINMIFTRYQKKNWVKPIIQDISLGLRSAITISKF
jgi:hypothetical protein